MALSFLNYSIYTNFRTIIRHNSSNNSIRHISSNNSISSYFDTITNMDVSNNLSSCANKTITPTREYPLDQQKSIAIVTCRMIVQFIPIFAPDLINMPHPLREWGKIGQLFISKQHLTRSNAHPFYVRFNITSNIS